MSAWWKPVPFQIQCFEELDWRFIQSRSAAESEKIYIDIAYKV